MKITQKARQEYIRERLGRDQVWALRGLQVVFANQTAIEQEIECTTNNNNIGFTVADANFLTSLAKQYLRRGSLSERQMSCLFWKMPKYAGQILKQTDKDKLDTYLQTQSL